MEKYERQANISIILSAMAYLNFENFSKNDNYIFEGLDYFLNKRKRQNEKLQNEKYLNSKTFKIDVPIKDIFLNDEIKYVGKENKDEYDLVKKALITNDDLKDCRLVNLSSLTDSFSKSTLEALTIVNKNELYIVFRGTGAGKWIDNGQGLYGMSETQFEATRYFQEMVKLYGEDKKIYLTGHSKGGNLAQAALMASKDGPKVEKVFSFDGQGFSKEAIDYWKTRKEKERSFSYLTNKIYTIAATNDFVNPLGLSITPKKNVFFIKDNIDDIPHKIQNMLYKTKLDFSKKEGHIVSAERGPIGNLANTFYQNFLKLNKRERDMSFIGGMAVVNKLASIGYKDHPYEDKVNGSGTIKKVSPKCIESFCLKGLPVIKETLSEIDIKTTQNLLNKKKMKGLLAFVDAATIFNPQIAHILIMGLMNSSLENTNNPTPSICDMNAFKVVENKYEDKLLNSALLSELDKSNPEACADTLLQFAGGFLNDLMIEQKEDISLNKESNEREILKELQKEKSLHSHKRPVKENIRSDSDLR